MKGGDRLGAKLFFKQAGRESSALSSWLAPRPVPVSVALSSYYMQSSHRLGSVRHDGCLLEFFAITARECQFSLRRSVRVRDIPVGQGLRHLRNLADLLDAGGPLTDWLRSSTRLRHRVIVVSRGPLLLAQCNHAQVARLNKPRAVRAGAENIPYECHLGTTRRKRSNRTISPTNRFDVIAASMPFNCSQR